MLRLLFRFLFARPGREVVEVRYRGRRPGPPDDCMRVADAFRGFFEEERW